MKKEITKNEYYSLIGLFALAAVHYAVIRECENTAHELTGETKDDIGSLSGERLFDYAINADGNPARAVKELLKIKEIKVV